MFSPEEIWIYGWLCLCSIIIGFKIGFKIGFDISKNNLNKMVRSYELRIEHESMINKFWEEKAKEYARILKEQDPKNREYDITIRGLARIENGRVIRMVTVSAPKFLLDHAGLKTDEHRENI